MTAVAPAPRVASATPSPVRVAVAFELRKLTAPWRTRGALLACWTVPALLVAVVSTQRSLPTDTAFGRWMGQSGWAGSLVALSFCGSWVLPLVTVAIAGDSFAVEDRSGTWGHLLVTVRSPRRVFAAKATAALVVVMVAVTGLAASSTAGGLAASGTGRLVGLDGHPLTTAEAAELVLLAWLTALVAALAFAALGLLGSVLLGRSPAGLLAPLCFALLLQLAQLLPMPVVLRLALPSYGFLAWRGLFTDPAQTGPLVTGLMVGVTWAVLGTALAHLAFRRRNFADPANDGPGARALGGAVVPLAVLLATSAGVVQAVASPSAAGIDAPRLEASLATVFGHLYRMQSDELHRPDVTEQQLRSTARCDKGGPLVDDAGPGNDWRCVVTWRIPGATATGSAVYQLDVAADGRYVADGDGPQPVNGFFTVSTPSGRVPNPLWQLDGTVDLLNPS